MILMCEEVTQIRNTGGNICVYKINRLILYTHDQGVRIRITLGGSSSMIFARGGSGSTFVT